MNTIEGLFAAMTGVVHGHISRELSKLSIDDLIKLDRAFSAGDYPSEWTQEERREAFFTAEWLICADYYRRGRE